MPLIPDLAAVIIDCCEAPPMLAFYQAACGGKIVHGNNDLAWLKVGGVRVLFREVEDYKAPTWPSSDIPAQMHLDFFADDLDETEVLLHQLGATTPDYQPRRKDGLALNPRATHDDTLVMCSSLDDDERQGAEVSANDRRLRRRARYVPCDALSHGVSEYVEGGWLMPGT